MGNGLNVVSSVNFLLVFLEGIISFFSPCVIPLIPVYMSYLAGNAKSVDNTGMTKYQRKKVLFYTLFFILGISFAFFILGMSFTTIGRFFSSNKLLFTRIGGIIIIILGLFQLGIFNLSFLHKERKIYLNLENKRVNPIMAFIMGFTFSFAWTPCVGPMLSSVLLMASGAKTIVTGNLLVMVYTLGFILPFLLLGLFTTEVLSFLKAKKKLLQYTVKIGGVILVLMGVMTFTGWMNGISSYLNSISWNQNSTENSMDEGIINNEHDIENNNSDSATEDIVDKEQADASKDVNYPAFDFTLFDQYGNEHTLSDYKGKVVFLNFWATWCPPCKKEMPDIEELYQEFNLNEDEVIILGVANPKSEQYPNNNDVTKDEIIDFLDENNFTFPTVFDETGELLYNYYISAFPTTFMIDKEGNLFGYVPGMLTKDMMLSIIDQTLESSK